jgi:hypothetical protein
MNTVSKKGRVFVGTVDVISPEGGDRWVSIRLEPNTEDGRVLMTADKALEVAARLMVHAEKAG